MCSIGAPTPGVKAGPSGLQSPGPPGDVLLSTVPTGTNEITIARRKGDNGDMRDLHRCADCPIRRKAEAKPGSWLAKIWKWHTRWCPGWKAYQKSLIEQEKPAGS